MSKASEIMGRAKAALVLEQAFFASIICSMKMIEDETLNPPTMATNGKWVRYHPVFVETMNFDEVKFVLCHEVGHCIFAHMFRRGDRDHATFNQAGDYVINDMLIKAKIGSMPSIGLNDPGLVAQGDGTTDGVYDILWREKQNGGGRGGGQDGQGGAMDDCQDSGGSEADSTAAEAEMKVKIAHAAQAAKMCGQMTAEISRLVDEAMKPKVDWKDVLRRFVSDRAKIERSYARPNRRFLGEGLYLPSLGGNQMGAVAVAIDVSGSISDKEVAAFFAEIKGIKADVQPSKLDVIYFHHNVAHHDTFLQDDEPTLTKTGSGGTNFSPIFREIEDTEVEPVCCVVLTDLCCHDFGPQPSYPVLWVTTCPGQAPWGDIIEMDPHHL